MQQGCPFGFVATKSIAKGSNNEVLKRICSDSKTLIFEAWTNEEWVIDGAQVRVSLICVDRPEIPDLKVRLNGAPVSHINSDLTTGLDFAIAKPLRQNSKIAFQGVKLNGPFDVDDSAAIEMIAEPLNVNDRPNTSVVRRFIQNDDVTGRPGVSWVIDFSDFPELEDANKFEMPFKWVTDRVLPYRNALETSAASETTKLSSYWLMQRPRPELRKAIEPLTRCILVPETSEHRIFVWSTKSAVFSGSLFVIARDDDPTYGILCSRFHDSWATAQGNRLGAGNQRRYNATRTFETFPFPEGLTPNIPANNFADNSHAAAIGEAARNLEDLRNKWLNPSDLVRIKPEAVPTAAERKDGAEQIYPDRILPKDAQAEVTLRARTMNKLYKQRPQWLIDAHKAVDTAVAAAYGWPADITEEDALARLLELNLSRSALPKSGKAVDADSNLLDEEE